MAVKDRKKNQLHVEKCCCFFRIVKNSKIVYPKPAQQSCLEAVIKRVQQLERTKIGLAEYIFSSEML